MYRSSPAKPAMNAATSSRPCSESAASWSAAIHPSVRPSSAATSGCRQHQSHHLAEVRRGLGGREAQIGGAELDELAAPSQPRQRQRRVGAAGDHQVNLRRQVLQQEGHPVLHLARVDDVVVVEHQHDIVRDGVEVVKQSDKARLARRLGRLQERERTCRTRGRRRLQRGDKVRPEQRGIVVALVEREPRHGPSIGRSGCQPLRQQRRLTEPGRRRHQRQRRLRPAAQALAQSRARDQIRVATWGGGAWSRAVGLPWPPPLRSPVFTCRQERTRGQPHDGWLPHRVRGSPENIWSRGSTVRGFSADPRCRPC